MKRTKRENGRISAKEAEDRLLRYGWCRGVTHFWDKNGPIEVDGRTYKVSLKCQHCGTERVAQVAQNGALIGGTYTYRTPKDYRTPGFNAQRADLRRMLFVQGRAAGGNNGRVGR